MAGISAYNPAYSYMYKPKTTSTTSTQPVAPTAPNLSNLVQPPRALDGTMPTPVQSAQSLEQQKQQNLVNSSNQLAYDQRAQAFRQEQDVFNRAQMLAGNSNNPLQLESDPSGLSMTIGNQASGGSGTRNPSSGTGTGGPGTIPPELLEAFKPLAPPTLPGAPALPARTPLAAPTLEDPAQAFAAAKDVSGSQGQAAIRALRDAMTARGMSDSGLENELGASILGQVATYNADADRSARTRNVDRMNEFALANAGIGSGERGQDTGYNSNTYGTQAGYGADIYGSQVSQRNNALDGLLRWYALSK